MVEANIGEYTPGTIIATWDEGYAYLIRLSEDGSEVWAPVDIDDYVRAPVPQLQQDAGDSCRGDPFQGHFYGDTYQIKGQTGLVHELKVDEFSEDNDGNWQVVVDELHPST